MHKMSEKKVIAITGTIGSGKSMVSSILSKNYPVIDCDQINAKLLEKNEDGYNELIKLPWIILDDNGNIDKKKMASSMFSNREYKEKVESILHPLIFKKIDEWKKNQSSSLIFVEVPILFEIQAQSHFDEIWCVSCDLDTALNRLVKYRNFTYDEAMMRVKHQLDPEYKKKLSDVVILNDGSIADLEKQINEILAR